MELIQLSTSYIRMLFYNPLCPDGPGSVFAEAYPSREAQNTSVKYLISFVNSPKCPPFPLEHGENLLRCHCLFFLCVERALEVCRTNDYDEWLFEGRERVSAWIVSLVVSLRNFPRLLYFCGYASVTTSLGDRVLKDYAKLHSCINIKESRKEEAAYFRCSP